MIRPVLLLSISMVALGPCSKSGDASSVEGGAVAPSDSSAPTADAPKPPAPADAAKSCSATPLKVIESGGEQVLEYTLKNTGTHPWHYCNVVGFEFDKSGNLLGMGGISENTSLAPGAQQTSTIRIKDAHDKTLDAATLNSGLYELVSQGVHFDDKSEWEDKSNVYGRKKAVGTPVPLSGGGGGKPATAPAGATKPTGKK